MKRATSARSRSWSTKRLRKRSARIRRSGSGCTTDGKRNLWRRGAMPIDPPKRILIVKLSAIGDVLMATPAAKALRTAFPDSYIAWIVEKKSADVALGNPYLNEVIVWDRTRGAK